MTQEERISNLEKRMSALERNLQDRQKIGNEIISSWQKVMYEFCITYGIDISHIELVILLNQSKNALALLENLFSI